MKELKFFQRFMLRLETFIHFIFFSPVVIAFQPKEGCALCPLHPEETLCQLAKQHQGNQYIAPVGQLLAPLCHYCAMLGWARSSTHSTLLFAMKDRIKKIAVPRIKLVEKKQTKQKKKHKTPP